MRLKSHTIHTWINLALCLMIPLLVQGQSDHSATATTELKAITALMKYRSKVLSKDPESQYRVAALIKRLIANKHSEEDIIFMSRRAYLKDSDASFADLKQKNDSL
jgi:hypothetical protein